MKRTGLVVAYGLMGVVLAGCPKDKQPAPPATGPSIKWSIADVSVDESAGTAKLTVSLSALAPAGMTVKYSTSDGSATAPGDYESASNATLTIPEGKTSAKISIPLVDDPSVEGDETFTVTLSAPSKGTLDKASAVVTLIDDTGPSGAGGEGGMGTGSGGTGASGGASNDGGADSTGGTNSTGGTDSTGDGGESASGGTKSSGGKGGTSSGGKGGTSSGGSSGSAGSGGSGNNDTGNLYLRSFGNAITVCQLVYCTTTAHLFFYPQGGDPNDTIEIDEFVVSNDRTKLAAFGKRIHTDEDATQNFELPILFIGTIPKYLTSSTSSTALGFKELALGGHASLYFGREYAADGDVGVWSPDNQHVAFIARPYIDEDIGYAPAATDALYVADADGTYVERIPLPAKDSVSYAQKNIHWSADSTALGFLARRAEPGPENFIDAFTWTKAGGLKSYPQDFLNSADGMLPRPGSGHDYVYGFGGTIYVVTAGSTTPTPLTQPTELASHPRWSPDGLHIAFWATADGETAKNIWVMDDDGGNRHQVTFGGSITGKPFAYSPDGSLIAYASDEEAAGHPRLYQINGDAPTVAKRKQLSPDADTIAGVSDWDPVWSKDSAYVAYGWYDATNHDRIQIATADDARSGITVSPADHRVLVEGAPSAPWRDTYRALTPCWSSSAFDQLGFVAQSDDGFFQNVYRVKADGSDLLQMYVEGPDLPTEPVPTGWLTWDAGDNLAAQVRSDNYYRVWAGDSSNTVRSYVPSSVEEATWGSVH